MLPVETRPITVHAKEIEKAFLQNHDMVYRVAFRVTGNASDAEDVLQTLFLRLVRREWLPDTETGWPGYLHRATVNIALDIMRARARQAPLDESAVNLREYRPGPHEQHSASELRVGFNAALAELSPNAAEMFVLRHVEGFAIQEIAKMLQTSKGTVAVTLFRTRRRLRKSITKFLGGR
jgi:RNA polymerase sigma-70 factor, ECF subfamily